MEGVEMSGTADAGASVLLVVIAALAFMAVIGGLLLTRRDGYRRRRAEVDYDTRRPKP